jgi:hypothetical protein
MSSETKFTKLPLAMVEGDETFLVRSCPPTAQSEKRVDLATFWHGEASNLSGYGISEEEARANARLFIAAPEIYQEHSLWAHVLGRVLIEALQGNYDYLNSLAKTIPSPIWVLSHFWQKWLFESPIKSIS